MSARAMRIAHVHDYVNSFFNAAAYYLLNADFLCPVILRPTENLDFFISPVTQVLSFLELLKMYFPRY